MVRIAQGYRDKDESADRQQVEAVVRHSGESRANRTSSIGAPKTLPSATASPTTRRYSARDRHGKIS
jgi:hypothetical protein